MNNTKTKKINSYKNILESFNNKCVQNEIWYSIYGLSLLNCQRQINQNDKNIIDVLMSPDSYLKFRNLFTKNILDMTFTSYFFLLNPFYFEMGRDEFIRINIVSKATIKKTQKIYSIKNLIRENIGYYKTNARWTNNVFNFKNLFYKFMNLFFSPITWTEVVSSIYDEKNDGFFIIDNLKNNINKKWLPSLTMNTIKTKWLDCDTFVIDENKNYLIKKYGMQWQTFPLIEKDLKTYSFLKNIIEEMNN